MKTSMIAHVNLVPRAMQEAHLRARYITRWAIGVMAVLTLVGLPGLYIGGNAVLSDPAVGVQIEQVHVQVKSNRDAIPKLQQELARSSRSSIWSATASTGIRSLPSS